MLGNESFRDNAKKITIRSHADDFVQDPGDCLKERTPWLLRRALSSAEAYTFAGGQTTRLNLIEVSLTSSLGKDCHDAAGQCSHRARDGERPAKPLLDNIPVHKVSW